MRYLSFFVLAVCCAGISRAQVSVKAAVDHIIPDGIDNTGNITLTVSGSTSPYTYTWNPGAISTQNLSNTGAGSYSLQVKSASSQTFSTVYSLGYKVQWTKLTSGYFRNDTLAGAGFAVSRNTLPANTDGWVEVVHENPTTGGTFYIGFTDSLSPVFSTNDIDFGFESYASGTALYAIENGTLTSFGAPKTGDVLRIERVGNTINYRVNGTIRRTRTVTGLGQKTLKLRASIAGSAKLINTGCSFMNLTNATFKNYVNVRPIIKHSSGTSMNDGQITLKPTTSGPYTFTWSPGNTGSTWSSLGAGSYSVTVEDNEGNKSPYTYNLGYRTNWTNVKDGFFRNDSLSGYANSANSLLSGTDGWWEVVIDSLIPKNSFVGFTDSLSPINDISDIDYGIELYAATSVYSIENGVLTLIGAQRAGDLIRVERTGNTINYKINGATVRSVTSSGLGQRVFKLRASVAAGAQLVNVGCSFQSTGVLFKNYVGVTPLIKHSSSFGMSDGQISILPKLAGSYSYTWQQSGSTTATISALSAGKYDVVVQNSMADRSPYSYNLGYKVMWQNLTGGYFRNDTLSGITDALSKNVLPPNTNGWVEYSQPPIVNGHYYIGFADSTAYLGIDYGIYGYAGTRMYYYENAQGAIMGAWNPGDLIRVERIGDTMRYSMNGTVLRSVTVSGISQKKLWLMARVMAAGIKLVNVGCSFSVVNPLAVAASVTNYASENSKGQIQYSITGGIPPYNVAWQGNKLPSSTVVYHALIDSMPGTVIDSVAFKAQIDALKQQTLFTGLNPGTYTTTVYSNAPDSAMVVSTVGGPDSLSFSRGITTSLGSVGTRTVNGTVYNYGKGLTLTQQGTYSAGNHYAMLRAGFDSQTGGAINFVVPAASTKASVGLQEKKDGVDGYPDEMMVRTMFRLNGNGTFDIIYQNATVSSGSVAAGDMFSIRKEASGTKLGYYKNEALLIEKDFSTIAPAAGLIGKALLGGAGMALGPINISFLFAPSVSISTVDMVCGDNCTGKITAVGSSGLIPSNPYSYALFDASDLLLSTMSVTSTANTATFQNLCAGKYTLKYTYQETPLYDLNSGSAPSPVTKTISQAVDVGYMPSWTNLANASDIAPNHSLQKISGATQAWNAGASTFNTLKAGAPETHWMEWSANAVADDQNCFGLTGADVGTNPFALDFHGIYLYRSGKTNVYTLLSGGASLLNGAGTYAENDKFRIEKTVSGSTYSIVFRKNNVVIGQVNSIVNKDFVADASIYRLNDKIYLPRLSFGCPDAPVYAILKRKLDGGYYQVMNKELYFKYTEEYADQDGKLLFNVYNDQNQRVVNGTNLGTLTPSVAFGDNYYRVDLGNTGYSGGQSLPAGYYLLEVINEKNEKWYLRFKK